MRGMADSRLTQLSEHLYCFSDICNVYVIVDEGAALLIDSGSGAVAEALADTGASAVEWVLHIHHHRDQCAGAPALAAAGAKVAAPEHELAAPSRRPLLGARRGRAGARTVTGRRPR